MTITSFDEITKPKKKCSLSDLDGFYDCLTPVSCEEMIGKWKGAYIPTGSIYDLFLKKFPLLHWHGKKFKNANQVNALIMDCLGLKIPVPMLGSAVLRQVNFRGKPSMSMIYNYLPIIDHFRKVNHNSVMGVMTIKDRTEVYFYLEREEQAKLPA